MDTVELKKSKVHIIAKIIGYVSNAVVSKTGIKKTTGKITVIPFKEDKEPCEKTSPFDTNIQIIEVLQKVLWMKSNSGLE